MKCTVKWPTLLIHITLSLKNPTMTRYNISGLFLLPQALPIQTSAPNACDGNIRLPKLSCMVGGQDEYDRYHHFGCGSNVERHIIHRLLRIILTLNQFERMTRHHCKGALAVTCRNCPQGGSFHSISIGRQNAVHVQPALPTQ
jgi:hypothetical protein